MFLYNGKCYSSCPKNLVADNLDLTCKEEKDNPIYIKAYTISRCLNSCGKIFFDCSCNNSCIKNGTCCSDFRFCQVVEENHINNSNIPNCKLADEEDTICLQCKENFYYYDNKCLLKCPTNGYKDNNNKIFDIRKINKDILNTSYDSNENLNSITKKIKANFANMTKTNKYEIIPYEENKICKKINLGIYDFISKKFLIK